MEKINKYECAYCHKRFAIWDTRLVNRGIEGKEIRVCDGCAKAACNNGKVIQCDACGESFTSNVLHDEEIDGHSFTSCPSCGKDMVEGLTREEYENEYRIGRYAVTVWSYNGSLRGYIVSMASGKGIRYVIDKLAEKVNLDNAATVTAAEILSEDDEF